MLQGGAAGRADAESAQEGTAQLQTPVVAAVAKQDASITTDVAAHAPARSGPTNDPLHVTQDVVKPAEHAGGFFQRHSAFWLPPVHCMQSGASACAKLGGMQQACNMLLGDCDGLYTGGHTGSPPQTGGPVASKTRGTKRPAEPAESAPVCPFSRPFGSNCVSTCTAGTFDVQALPHGLCQKGRP